MQQGNSRRSRGSGAVRVGTCKRITDDAGTLHTVHIPRISPWQTGQSATGALRFCSFGKLYLRIEIFFFAGLQAKHIPFMRSLQTNWRSAGTKSSEDGGGGNAADDNEDEDEMAEL